jgi:cell division septal protein FtsQ
VRRRPLPSRLISASLLVVAGWLIYWFASADAFYIHSVRVNGNWRVSDVELLATSGLEGINIFWADTRAAAEAMEALPDILSAQVRCGLLTDCDINVVERPTSLVWQQGEARVWIGADGVAVPARGELPNAVVLEAAGSTALRPGERLDPTLVTAVEELERLQPMVRAYQYSDRYGLLFENDYGWPVRLGGSEEIATKLMLLQALTDHLLNQGIEPAFIDVRYLEAPYYGE